MFWGSGLYENLICSKIEKKVQVFFCYHRLSWFHTCLLYDNNANYGKMNLSLCNEILTPFLMIWMFFRAFYLFVCDNDFNTSTFCMTIYMKKSFFPGEYEYSTLCRIDHLAIHRDIARKTSILLNIIFCVWKNMRLIWLRRTVKIKRWWVTKKQKNWIF